MSDSTPDKVGPMVKQWEFIRDHKPYAIRWVRNSRELHLYERAPGDATKHIKRLPVILPPGATQDDVYNEVLRVEEEGW